MNIASAKLSALIDNIKIQLEAGFTAVAQNRSSPSTTGRIRLAKLRMPTFAGARTGWDSFSDFFQAAVGSSSLFYSDENIS